MISATPIGKYHLSSAVKKQKMKKKTKQKSDAENTC